MAQQSRRSLRPSSSVITNQPGVSLDGLAVLAPSLRSSFVNGASAAAPGAGIGEQLGVTAFTDGIYTEGGINPALSEVAMESTGRMMTEVLGEDTVEKLEQRYAKAVDKIADMEMSAKQAAMVGQSLDYLAEAFEEEEEEEEEEVAEVEAEEMEPVEMRQMPVPEEDIPVDDVPDTGEIPDMFFTPEADEIAPNLGELDADQLGQMATAPGQILQTEEVTDAADAETDGCCCCCGEDGGDDLCGCGDMCDMCGCGGCCGCSGLCGCGDLCDCGDCFGCGDCIGCGDCTSCCSFDCSIM